MSQQPAWRRASTTARSPKASSASASLDADREKLLQFMNIGRDDDNSFGNTAQMNSFRRHHRNHHHQNRRRRRRDEEGFLRRFVGRRLMRGTLMQKMVLFGPMLWFAVSLGALVRYKSTKESQSALTMGDDADDGAFVTTRLKTGGGEVEEEMTVHEKAPITFESDEKMQRDREREEAMIARGRHPCLNNGVYKVETDECVCHGGWKGENCDRAICEEVNCVNGRCVKPDVCECFPGFSKFDCSKDYIRDESGMLLDHLQVRLHATSIGLSKKDPAEAIELVQRWGISSSRSGSNSKSGNEVNGPWLAREDALGNRVLKSDQNLHNKLFFSCAVVGNSFHLEKVDGLAEVVDEHEAVIRLDAAPTTGRFASMVGTKTTVRVLSDAFLEDALKNPSKYAKLFTSTNGVSNSGNWETKGILWEPNSVSKLRQARRAFPELDVQFASPEILYPAKTIFNEVYNRLNAETKEHIEKALFGDTNGKDESSSNVDKGGRGYSFFSSSSSKSSSSEVTNTSELKPTLSNAFFAVFLSLQMCVNVNVYGIDPPHEFLHDDDHDEKDSYFDGLSGGNGLGVSPASKIYESLLLRLFHDRRLATRCDGFARAQKCVSFTPRGRKGLIARQAVHW